MSAVEENHIENKNSGVDLMNIDQEEKDDTKEEITKTKAVKGTRQKKPKKIYHWLNHTTDVVFAKEEAISLRNAVRKFSKLFKRHSKATLMFVLDVSEQSIYILRVTPQSQQKNNKANIADPKNQNHLAAATTLLEEKNTNKRASVDIDHLYICEKTTSAIVAEKQFVEYLTKKKQELETTTTTTTTTTNQYNNYFYHCWRCRYYESIKNMIVYFDF